MNAFKVVPCIYDHCDRRICPLHLVKIALVQDSRVLGRIIHCASYGGSYSGSFVPMLAAAATVARDRGYDTTICFSEVARGQPWLGELSEIAELRFIKPSGVLADMQQLKRILDETDRLPTVLHTHFGTFDIPAALLRLRRRRTAVLWHLHSGRDRRIRLRTKTYGAVFGRIVSAIVCVSREMYEAAPALGFPPGKLRLLSNAIDLARFEPVTPAERAAARRQLGLSPDARVVLHFAWDWVIKGGDRLLATADLMTSEPGLAFLTVVSESPGNAPQDLLESHPTVQPLTPRGNVNELYAAADVLLNCSRAEGGIPYAVLEALARGLPVVATAPPVQRDVLDGLPGARVIPPEPKAISIALREVLALTPEQRSAHAAAARARVAASYSLNPWARRLVDLYDEALTGTLPT
jgi:glycosyltransferase involved in cell wall biosynthesis